MHSILHFIHSLRWLGVRVLWLLRYHVVGWLGLVIHDVLSGVVGFVQGVGVGCIGSLACVAIQGVGRRHVLVVVRVRHVLAVEIVEVTSLIDRVRLLLVIHLLAIVVHLIETSRQICVPTIMCPSFLIELSIGQLVISLVL